MSSPREGSWWPAWSKWLAEKSAVPVPHRPLDGTAGKALKLALCLCLIVMAINVPVLATALELAPIGTKGWTLALACSLMPLVGGQIWLGLSRGHAPAHATGTVMPRQGRLE